MKPALFTFIIGLLSLTVVAQKQAEVFSTKEGAINGYDAVAYFIDKKPVKGNSEFKYTWKGASWLFSSKQNLALFKADPEKFEPQYGGYCAYGVAQGYKAATEPSAWRIVEGKLYLNYNASVQSDWVKNQNEFIIKANQNWPTIKK